MRHIRNRITLCLIKFNNLFILVIVLFDTMMLMYQ